MTQMFDTLFYQGKRVLVTGHTGFKGAWLCKVLCMLGAEVTGYALQSPTKPSLFDLCDLSSQMNSIIGDIRDITHLQQVFDEVKPEVVFHLAAQPIVKEGYKNPVYTYETNVMGTVNVLECIRNSKSVKSFVNVTTDKVYLNREKEEGYKEDEILDGYDPYSNSKSCSELVTHSYVRSYFQEEDAPAISTARAGNVIGGGDFAPYRIVPDCVRAMLQKVVPIVRNPLSVRPYQHVLEPICVYMMIAEKQYRNKSYAGCYNVGPDDKDCITTEKLVECFIQNWDSALIWECKPDGGAHEAGILRLDCSKLKNTFAWAPYWDVQTAINKTVEWYKCWINGNNISFLMERQIEEFLEL